MSSDLSKSFGFGRLTPEISGVAPADRMEDKDGGLTDCARASR